MAGLKGLNLVSLGARPPLPKPRVIQVPSREAEQIIETETRIVDATIAVTDEIINSTPGGAQIVAPTESNIDGDSKLSRLLDDNFPFDDTQLAAVYGMIQEQYACMIGAAGTGKTTTEQKLVDLLQDGLDEIDVSTYWKRGSVEDDDYEIPEKLIPNILMCSFTGRSTQATKSNFPRDWHGNIMTIHRALGFYPEYFSDWDETSQQMINKRRFVPAYTAENKMPWKIIIIDEAGMLGLDLWHQLWAACEPDTRIYMVGDIQQLKPTHGHSILGFALNEWPTWELTHVHRQKGKNNSIVDAAHAILKGKHPVSDIPNLSFKTPQQIVETLTKLVKDKTWRFVKIDVDEDHRVASARIRQGLKMLHHHLYEPNRDAVITPINGYEQTSPGYSLGQDPMNQALVTMLNPEATRFLIDAGREKQNFAVGDKVMATVNDYEAGITNGMTGIILSIARNAAYMGDTRRWGPIDEVNAYFESIDDEDDEDDEDFNLEEMVSDAQAGIREKEKKSGGPASHIITVQFGDGEHAFEIPFNTQSAVASVKLAYVSTCHKLQGGQAPLVMGIIHQAHKRMLEREWGYTMVTRAADRCIVFGTRQGWGFCLGKQAIKGATLKQKIATFSALTERGLLGPTVKVRIPARQSLVSDLTHYEPQASRFEASETIAPVEASAAQTELRPSFTLNIKNATIIVGAPDSSSTKSAPRADVDGGDLKPEKPLTPKEGFKLPPRNDTVADWDRVIRGNAERRTIFLPETIPSEANHSYVSQWGAYKILEGLQAKQPLLLTHQPAPEVAPKKPNPLAALLAKQGVKR